MMGMKGNTIKEQLFGIALMILGLTMRVRPMDVSFGVIVGVGATWIGLLIVIIATCSRDG